MTATVHEERGRAGHTAQVGAVDVVGDPPSTGVCPQIARELLDVETDLLRVPNEIVGIEGVLVG